MAAVMLLCSCSCVASIAIHRANSKTIQPLLLARTPNLLKFRHRPFHFLSHKPLFSRLCASSFDLSPPPIDHDLFETVTSVSVAKVSEDGIVETYDNDDAALDAAYNGVLVGSSIVGFDLLELKIYGIVGSQDCLTVSCFGFVLLFQNHVDWYEVSGEDRIHFLHNQSTANFECLREGQGCDTVFVTPTARTIDIAFAWVMKSAITLVVSPETSKSITEMLNKYIFFADKVEIEDITKQTSFFVLIGPKSNQVMQDLNLGDVIGQPYGTHRHYSVNGMPITVGVGNLISEVGFSILMSPAAAGSVWKTLLSHGAIPMGSNAWEKLRVLQGRPAPGKELTDEFNVLEANLWKSISLNKGCYKGQETVSRLITYDGVKQRLWGISLSAPAEPGSPISVDGKKVGKLTSYVEGRNPSEYFGLGYIKRQGATEGDRVIVADNIVGTVVEVPYLAGQSLQSISSA
ncbi:Aminomethyltransferase, folate-binding domain [Dillenia turbinata]|uniref:Aminomethyltransferase, folate-binding domain n=1 Tax=Dillenia turbinata TaxID=194707 RepID=A0AAN8WCV2_9MAGN